MLRIPIIVITIIWLVVAGYFASKLGPLTEQEKFVDDSHPVQRPLTVLAKDFNTRSDSKPTVQLFFGIKDIDRTDSSMWVSDFVGEAILDEDFNIGIPDSQKFLNEFCNDLKAQTFIVEG